jgi:hypothetical protein
MDESTKMASNDDLTQPARRDRKSFVHDVNTPLTNIIARAELIQDTLTSTSPDLRDVLESARIIQETAYEIAALVKALQ